MKKFGRREESETKARSKIRHGLMSVVVFDHQEVCVKAKAFITSIENAAISLANWSTNEENAAIQDTCERMYELTMLLSSVIDLFSKEYTAMGNSLKELLRQEMNLDDLNKKVCQAKVKATKLKKQNIEKEKNLENLGNAELEYEELKATFDAQNTKHEILKAQCLRQSITRLAEGTKSFAQRVSTISEAEKKMASSIPVVPTQIGRKEYDGVEATEEVIKRTVDALNISRPIPFTELLARKRARARKRVKSCFLPEEITISRPEEMEWLMVEESMCTSLLDPSKDTDGQDEDRRLNPELLSHLKQRLSIDGSDGKSYISNPVIEQRLALKAQGLDSSTNNNLSPCFHRRKVPEPQGDLPRVEPYAVGRWKPNEAGLYALADLYPSGATKFSHSWQGDEKSKERSVGDSGEYTLPKEFLDENEVVYAVLEQEKNDVTKDDRYLDVIE